MAYYLLFDKEILYIFSLRVIAGKKQIWANVALPAFISKLAF
jgi:hypothetical protein